jgi:uncharacterized protein YhaN
MRIRRLDLLRYGRFTDAALELPAHNPDLHIVFGPNEAGKSTALSALEDLLFGIPKSSPLNFLHDYGSMRIGAVLERDGKKLEVRRRKGNKDTLLTPEEIPLAGGEGALASFLAGADRSFLSRMFSLDHERLRQGGREILGSRDEVGQMLFSAGAGIEGLRQSLMALREEADGLWASRRATRRKYYQAEERLKAAEGALRERTITASKWQDLKRVYEAAQDGYERLEREIQVKAVEQRKLNRIRRVYRDVRRHSELEAEVALLGQVIPLPEDARSRLEKAEQDDANAAARIETLTEQLEGARRERSALSYDEGLLLRAEEISQLHERRIQVRAGKGELPNYRAELAVAEAELRHLAQELGWNLTDIERLMGWIPARSKVARVRSLLNRQGAQLSATEAARVALEESEARRAEIGQQFTEMRAPSDVSTLAAVIGATRESADIASRISSVEKEAAELQIEIQRQLASLKPGIGDERALTSMSLPPRDIVQSHRDARRDLDQRLQGCRERSRAAEQELSRRIRARERIVRDERAVLPEQLARLRRHRDAGWTLIRRRYVEDATVPADDLRAFIGEAGDLPDAYEAAVSEADRAADQRLENAEAGARLALITRQIAEQEDLLEALRKEEEALGEESHVLDATWQEVWANAPFRPLSPDTMLEWITMRTELVSVIERRGRAERQIAILRREEEAAIGRLLKELEILGVDTRSLKGQALRVVLEVAAEVQRRREQEAETRQKLAETLRKAKDEAERKRKALEKAQRAWSEWESEWVEGLSSLGFAETSNPEAMSAQIEAIDELRQTAARVNELRHERIGKIEREVAAFGRDVAEIVNAVAADLENMEPDGAVLELERRLDEARRIRELLQGKNKMIASLEGTIRDHDDSRRKSHDIIRSLGEVARVESIDELRTAIQRSDRLRDLQAELSRVTNRLAEEGDGLSVAELHGECNAIDLDQIAAREEAQGFELDALRKRLMEAREGLTDSRQAFEAIGGDDAAARAAADRQGALAEMEEIAEHYVRVRSAALLLQWGIERYRREKQAPLLTRAGELFAVLTERSFVNLELEFDEQDHVHLVGVRPDGVRVGVEGMSTGTADQLYLALRVAAVEEYLQRAKALPFVADDLFINFDDGRAAAGLKVLGQLAKSCQVIFFTHHYHLLEIARSSLAEAISISSLRDGGGGGLPI